VNLVGFLEVVVGAELSDVIFLGFCWDFGWLIRGGEAVCGLMEWWILGDCAADRHGWWLV
jgi:hypothetical protein